MTGTRRRALAAAGRMRELPRVSPWAGAIRVLPLAASIAWLAAGCGGEPAPDSAQATRSLGSRALEEFDRAAVESLPGAPGFLDPETGTWRLSIPRPELVVTVDGATIAPQGGLDGWVAFEPVPGGAVLTAELPLLVDEVNPVLSAALLHDLHVTALGARLARAVPQVWTLHLSAIGETDSLAAGIGAVLQTLQDVKGQPHEPLPAIDPAAVLDPAPIDSVLGMRGARGQDGYGIEIPFSTRLEGYELGAASGIATRVTFWGSDTRAAMAGTLAVTEAELQPVLRSLRAGGVEIASIDAPLVGEDPPLVFVHVWGRGRATDLARALRDALDAR